MDVLVSLLSQIFLTYAKIMLLVSLIMWDGQGEKKTKTNGK